MKANVMWKDYRKQQKERREIRLPIRTKEILSLKNLFKIEEITPYQFRINQQIDIYPLHNRYHILETGERGGYREAKVFLMEFFFPRKFKKKTWFEKLINKFGYVKTYEHNTFTQGEDPKQKKQFRNLPLRNSLWNQTKSKNR